MVDESAVLRVCVGRQILADGVALPLTDLGARVVPALALVVSGIRRRPPNKPFPLPYSAFAKLPVPPSEWNQSFESRNYRLLTFCQTPLMRRRGTLGVAAIGGQGTEPWNNWSHEQWAMLAPQFPVQLLQGELASARSRRE